MTMTRHEIKSTFQIDNTGRIRDLGKFEREPLYAPYFWDAGLNGGMDEDENNVWFFILHDEDRLEFPELAEAYAVSVEESESGFVFCTVFGTREVYEMSVERMMLEAAQNREMDTDW